MVTNVRKFSKYVATFFQFKKCEITKNFTFQKKKS